MTRALRPSHLIVGLPFRGGCVAVGAIAAAFFAAAAAAQEEIVAERAVGIEVRGGCIKWVGWRRRRG